jgi:hypothetical protein
MTLLVARLAIVILLALGSTPAGVGVAAVRDLTTPIATDARHPVTDGVWVAWVTQQNPGNITQPTTILARSVHGGETKIVAASNTPKNWLAIDDGILVWIELYPTRECPLCNSALRAANLVTGETWTVSDRTFWRHASAPDISDGIAIWFDAAYDDATGEVRPAILGRNVRSMEPEFEIALTTEDSCYYRYPPRISATSVIWMECYQQDQPNPIASPGYRIWSMQFGDEGPTLLVDSAGSPGGFDIAGKLAIYADYYGGGMVVHDLTTSHLTFLDSAGEHPVIDGTTACWEHAVDQGEDEIERIDLRCADTRYGAIWTAIEDQGRNTQPQLANGWLAWERGDVQHHAHTDVHLAAVSAIVPAAPVTDPGDGTWFSESGHTLGWGFRAFWDANGGLPVFGFPLTQEFSERNPDTTTMRTVQYLERQRYEWHPENAGTPYAVLLGRLGAEDAARRGLTATNAFTSLPAAPDGSDCGWFAETGHSVCGRFFQYWSSHGLEFGDDGMTFRESLALFGFPLSEAFTDPESGLTTQYFERAVFEWHPANPTEYQVLLRRLGAELMVARGWRAE